MYPEIDIELVKSKMTRKDLSLKTGISYNSLLLKLTGKTIITLDESFAIKKALNSKLSIEKLFQKDSSANDADSDKGR